MAKMPKENFLPRQVLEVVGANEEEEVTFYDLFFLLDLSESAFVSMVNALNFLEDDMKMIIKLFPNNKRSEHDVQCTCCHFVLTEKGKREMDKIIGKHEKHSKGQIKCLEKF